MNKDSVRTKWTSYFSVEALWRILSAYVVGLAMVQVTVVGLSLGRVVLTRGVARAILCLAAVMAFLCWRWLAACTVEDEPEHVGIPWLRWAAIIIVVQALFTFGLLCLAAYVLPDRSFDGNAYHIPTIGQWAYVGYVHWITEPFPTLSFMNGYPKGVEVLSFVLSSALGSSQLVNVASLLFLPLGVIGISYVARLLGAMPWAALLSGAAFVLIPVNICQAPTTYTDSSYAATAVAFLAALVRVEDQARRCVIPKGDALVLGGALGLVLAVKSSGVALAAAGLGVLCFAMAVHIAHARYRAIATWATARFIVMAVVMGFLVGGYWYVRNYWHMGSPVYPVGLTVAGRTVFPGLSISSAIATRPNTPPVMRDWPTACQIGFTWLQGLSSWPESIEAVDSRLGGLGYLWVLGCLPAVAFVLYTASVHPESTSKRSTLVVLLAVVVSAFVVTPMNWWARYTIWVYAVGLPFFALALTRVGLSSRASTVVQLWVLACLALLTFEAGHSLRVTTRQMWVTDPLRALPMPAGILWQQSPQYVCPEMKGTLFDEILTSRAPVALRLGTGTEVESRTVMGALSAFGAGTHLSR
ncbi:MAG: hypothetical protein ACUVX9_07245 [Anaerolineae bacterium]